MRNKVIEELYSNPKTNAICMHLTKSKQSAEDLKQDVIIKLLANKGTEKMNGELLNLFFITARNTHIDNCRKKEVDRNALLAKHSEPILELTEQNEKELTKLSELKARLNSLDYLRREIYKMYLCGKDIRTIRKETFINGNSIVQYLHEANRFIFKKKTLSWCG